jgi:DNA helicase II / ATP-dependent DNA helicase PcrA
MKEFKLGFPPSERQIQLGNVVNEVIVNAGPGGCVVVVARAGSGKTVSMAWIAHTFIPKEWKCLYTSFANSVIADAGKKFPPNFTISGFHSMGKRIVYNCCGPHKLKGGSGPRDNKTEILLDAIYGINRWDDSLSGMEMVDNIELVNSIVHGVHLVKVCLVDPGDKEKISKTLDHYGISYSEKAIDIISEIVKISYTRTDIIDFDDMITLPVVLNLSVGNQFDLGIGDEDQDFNPAMRSIMKMLCKRTIFVGDDKQAIYGFNGADTDSIQHIIDEFGGITTPLDVNYRCHRKAIERAQRIVPDIYPWDGAPEGVEAFINRKDFLDTVRVNDMVSCRTNAPLFEQVFRLLAAGKPTKIKGKDTATQIKSLLESFLGRKNKSSVAGASLDLLSDKLAEYRDRETGKILRRKRDVETKLDLLDQKCESVDVFITQTQNAGGKTFEDLIKNLDSIFVKEFDGKTINLMTAHGCKGLEEDRVFILNYDKFRICRSDMPEWAVKQEANLEYVALTRSKQESYYVYSEDGQATTQQPNIGLKEKPKKATNPFMV